MQTSLSDQVIIKGRGLHTGEEASLRLEPAPAGSGIVFFREDLAPGIPIPALWRFVEDTRLSVTLGHEGVEIRTVEHLLSALAALGVDNCRIYVTGPEIPLCDGGAAVFFDRLKAVGLVRQTQARDYLVIRQPVWIEEDDRYLLAMPSTDLRISCSIHFSHRSIRYQACHLKIDPQSFASEIAPARTFCFFNEIESLKREGLAQGGDLETVLVYGETGPLNPASELEDECVRHKVLDIIGDLSLLGRPLKAHLIGHKTGHSLHLALVKKIARQSELESLRVEENKIEFLNFCQRVNL